MTKDALSKLKVEITTEALKSYIRDLVVTQEAIMFIKKQLEPYYKKKEKDRTEEDNQRIKRGEENIARYMEGITSSDERIANFLAIIDAYEHNKPVAL